MKDREIDDILKQASDAKPEVDRVLLEAITRTLNSNLRPVRALPPSWILALGLFLICGAVALAGAALLGLHGIHKMNAPEAGLIFSVLGLLIWLTATVCVAQAIPGSRRRLAPWMLEVSGCIGLAAVFALLFRDYGTEDFVSQGVKCLAAGLVEAVPASIGIWLLLKRGFAVESISAGFVRGTLAGLAGITMLELHCPNFEVAHLLVWHIAVMPISGAIGMLVAWAMGVRARRDAQRV